MRKSKKTSPSDSIENDDDSFEGSGFIFPELVFNYEFECSPCSLKSPGPLDKKHLLPVMDEFLWGEDSFAKVYMAFNEQGLFFQFDVQAPIESVMFPEYDQGDSIELFIDTRNNKQVRTTHRFCHHFCILPEPFEGIQAREITRFRSEDAHQLCNPDDIKVSIKRSSKGYSAYIMLPQETLFGYSPQDIQTLGFCYKINRYQESPQHFVLSSLHYKIEKYPYMWATIHLKS